MSDTEMFEIELSNTETDEDFIFVPTGKYEMLIRDSEKLSSLMRYLTTPKPTMSGIKIMMEV